MEMKSIALNTRSNRRNLAGSGVLAVLLVVGTMASPVSAQQGRSQTLSGESVAIWNLAGQVSVERGSGSDVVVEINRGGRDGDALVVESGRMNGDMALRIIYPDTRVIYGELNRGSRTTIMVKRDGTFGGNSAGARRVIVTGGLLGGNGLEAHADLTVKVPEGKKVAIYIGVGRIDAENINGNFRLDTHSGEVTANRVTGSLLVDTGSGRVTVGEIEGDLDIDTGSGSVRLNNVRGSDVRVDTGSGRVTGSGIETRKLEIDTGSGGIDVEDVSADDIKLDTGSGGVTLGLLSDVRNLVIDTGSGGVTVRVPRSISAEVEIDTGSGGISVDVPIEYDRNEKSYVRGTIGAGSGRIYIDTGSGSVRIHPR
ncbi:DUF4097 domain-containing protein [Candidatus Zixiibacteriota bacterium]